MSKPIELTKDFKEFNFLSYYKINRSKQYIYRCLACHYVQTGKTYDEVAAMLHYSRNSIMKWVSKYQEKGINALLVTKTGRGKVSMLSKGMSIEFNEAVISLQENRQGGRITGKDVVKFVEEQYGVKYSVSGIYKVLSRMGLSWVSGRSIHTKANPEAQETFKKNFSKNVIEITPKDVLPENIEIWFEDETRVGQQGSITRTWFYKGKRPRLVRQQQFLSAYIFGAVCPQKDKAVAFLSPVCNKESMQIHLNIIAESVEGHAVLVLDGAGWHSTKSLIIPKNITLLPLPPYSPELNPKENFWQSLKSQYLSNQVYTSVENIMDICEKAWLEFVNVEENVRKLCTRKWVHLN